MRTITLTEFNQYPSRATRLADQGDEVVVMRRGVAAYRLQRLQSPPADRLEQLIQAGLVSPARRVAGSRPEFPLAQTTADVDALLKADRNRLDD